MPGVERWTTAECAYCGRGRPIREADKARELKANPAHLFYCDGVCYGHWRAAQPTAVKIVKATCHWCGTSFDLQESKHKYRMRINGGFTYCGSSCASAGGKVAYADAMKAALATGTMTCSECKTTKPLDQFRLKTKIGRDGFPYLRICLACAVRTRAGSILSVRKDSWAERLTVQLKTEFMRDEDVIDISKCDHTPVEGPLTRAPDWRVLGGPNAAAYKWSCCICGFMHKEYEDAKECCEPKGYYKDGAFVAFDKYKPAAILRREAAGLADAAHAGAEGCGG